MSSAASYRSKAAALEKYRAIIRPYAESLPDLPAGDRQTVREFVMLVEEYAISLFAQQEVRTLSPVSEKRLDAKIAQLPRPKKA